MLILSILMTKIGAVVGSCYMTRFCVTLLWITSLVVGTSTVDAQVIRSHGIVKLKGNVAYPEELSGVTFWGDFLIACPDEGAEFNVFKCVCPNYELVTKVNLLSDPDEEIDMEGAASDSEYLYIVGSHSIRRKSIDKQGTYKKNRKRLTRVEPHTESYGLYRIKLNAAGRLMAKDRVDLRKFLETDEVMGPFLAIPGKENGIDIEGVAVKNGTIYVGFRGPVLRRQFRPSPDFRVRTAGRLRVEVCATWRKRDSRPRCCRRWFLDSSWRSGRR